MNGLTSLNWKQLESDGYFEFLSSWNWEWFGTLTFADSLNIDVKFVKESLKQWTINLCTQEHIQVGYWYAQTFNNNVWHIHFLMLGRGRNGEKGKTLTDVDTGYWEQQWLYRATIQRPVSQQAVNGYLARHIIKHQHAVCEMNYYNKWLLGKTINREKSGFSNNTCNLCGTNKANSYNANMSV